MSCELNIYVVCLHFNNKNTMISIVTSTISTTTIASITGAATGIVRRTMDDAMDTR